MNSDNDLKSVDSGNWFHTLITRSEKNTALVHRYAVSFVQFESVTACLSSRIPLKEIIEFKYSETKCRFTIMFLRVHFLML